MKDIKECVEKIKSSKTLNDYEKKQAIERFLFFKALNKQDDGRRNPIMTKEEFYSFDKTVKEFKYDEVKNKTTVPIYFKFEPYHDVSYEYCFENDSIFESRLYIGDWN